MTKRIRVNYTDKNGNVTFLARKRAVKHTFPTMSDNETVSFKAKGAELKSPPFLAKKEAGSKSAPANLDSRIRECKDNTEERIVLALMKEADIQNQGGYHETFYKINTIIIPIVRREFRREREMEK